MTDQECTELRHILGEKFWGNIHFHSSGHWLWKGNKPLYPKKDYPTFSARGHVYKSIFGPIERGMVLDNCGLGRKCIRPECLKLISLEEAKYRYGYTYPSPTHNKRFIRMQYQSCEFCGSKENLSIDHIVPQSWAKIKSYGIQLLTEDFEMDHETNMQRLCQSCHVQKTHIEQDLFSRYTLEEVDNIVQLITNYSVFCRNEW